MKADRVATPVAAGAQPGGAAFDFDQQIGVIQLASRSLFALPDDGRFARRACVFPAVQTTSDDVESCADTPARPFDAEREIDDPVIRSVELNVEEAKKLFGKPLDVRDRTAIEFIEAR